MNIDRLIDSAARSVLEHADAAAYLHSRGLTDEEITRYGLGYTSAPSLLDDGSEDYQSFYKQTFKLRALEDRILLPLRNSMGRANGVIARPIVVPEGVPKYRQYLTSEAKELGAFFGLREALPSILETGKVYVTEGAIDCMTLAKVFPNSVSVLTAYINEDQYWYLQMLAKSIIIVFDSDKTGEKGIDIVKAKYGSRGITARGIGPHDVNECYKTLGPAKFGPYMLRKLHTAA